MSPQVWQDHHVPHDLRGRCALALVVGVLLLGPLSAMAGGETRHVLVLSSSERPYAPQSGFAEALVRDLIRLSREPIQFVEVSVQAARASGVAPDAAVAQRIRSAFGADKLELVITIGGPAATFAQQFRHELFPATPLLLAGVDRRFVETGSFTANEAIVATQHDPALMIDEIVRLLPDTRQVMVVVGASQVEQFWLQEMKREFQRFGDRLQFSWTNELSYNEILERTRTMPAHSAIFFAILALDGKGEPLVERDTLKALHAVANAPMFSLYGMGNGIVGGPLLSSDDLSATTAPVALRMLAGESPGSIKTPVQRAGRPTYDVRELRRWKIDESRLPAASVVLFRELEPSPRNWRAITFGVLLVGLPLMSLAVVVGLMRHRRAERFRTAADSGSQLNQHLLQAQERDTAALARTLHEDICQRMVALTMRLHTLQGAAHAAEIVAIREQLARLAGELAAISDPIHRRLELLGFTTASRRLCEELSAQYNVAIHFQDDNVPRDVPGEVALVLFRVLQEATVNAVVHSGAREIWVSVRGTGAEVRLRVVDRGVGFATQKGTADRGVGLLAIRERLKLVDGQSAVVSTPREGTRVEAWVPVRRDGSPATSF